MHVSLPNDTDQQSSLPPTTTDASLDRGQCSRMGDEPAVVPAAGAAGGRRSSRSSSRSSSSRRRRRSSSGKSAPEAVVATQNTAQLAPAPPPFSTLRSYFERLGSKTATPQAEQTENDAAAPDQSSNVAQRRRSSIRASTPRRRSSQLIARLAQVYEPPDAATTSAATLPSPRQQDLSALRRSRRGSTHALRTKFERATAVPRAVSVPEVPPVLDEEGEAVLKQQQQAESSTRRGSAAERSKSAPKRRRDMHQARVGSGSTRVRTGERGGSRDAVTPVGSRGRALSYQAAVLPSAAVPTGMGPGLADDTSSGGGGGGGGSTPATTSSHDEVPLSQASMASVGKRAARRKARAAAAASSDPGGSDVPSGAGEGRARAQSLQVDETSMGSSLSGSDDDDDDHDIDNELDAVVAASVAAEAGEVMMQEWLQNHESGFRDDGMGDGSSIAAMVHRENPEPRRSIHSWGTDVPPVVLLRILRFIDDPLHLLSAVSQVCSLWHRVSGDDDLWRGYCQLRGWRLDESTDATTRRALFAVKCRTHCFLCGQAPGLPDHRGFLVCATCRVKTRLTASQAVERYLVTLDELAKIPRNLDGPADDKAKGKAKGSGWSLRRRSSNGNPGSSTPAGVAAHVYLVADVEALAVRKYGSLDAVQRAVLLQKDSLAQRQATLYSVLDPVGLGG